MIRFKFYNILYVSEPIRFVAKYQKAENTYLEKIFLLENASTACKIKKTKYKSIMKIQLILIKSGIPP